MKKVILAILLFAATFCVTAQEANKYTKIDSLLNYLYTNKKFMGSLAIREKGEVVFSGTYGYSDLAGGISANENTKYKIGSITKMFTASIIFQLIEEKKLTLDTRLSVYYPKIKNSDSITIGNMLNHTSGIYNFTDDSTLLFTKPQNRRDLLERLYSYEPVFDPGTKTTYSNSNYLLLGYIIQDITGKTYKENVTKRIINKVGLKNTYYFTKINPRKNEAYSYELESGDWATVNEWDESVAGAAGALQSTPEDLTQFITALFNEKIIKKESLEEMTNLTMGMGKGIMAFPFGERRFFGHNGSIEGFESVVAFYPPDKMAISLISNGLDYNFNNIMIGVLSCYYKIPYRFPDFTTITIGDESLKVYEGDYKNDGLPFTINVKAVDGKLRIHADEQGTFYAQPVSETEFIHNPSGIKIKFTKTGFTLLQNGTSTLFIKQ
ncbi:serine hydrolase domain-containing protein [Flavobacterium rhizosphaerae]|uniref:Serine hydrolase domain-containing protein n=1 Tax=Flavobacterium rhizosphaerae TaxID=3163298 RepID=A0ABW8YYY4_9FLAO